jgi:Protein of unknown function (DUF3306)
MSESDSNFLSRWSQRKQAKRQGVELAEPEAPAQPLGSEYLKQNRAVAGMESAQSATDLGVDQDPEQLEDIKPPPPTMQDAQLLTPESDFKPFMRADVTPEVKNAAMKQLFKDPHFNTMDMMDIYVDDYSKPDPLPPEMLRKMAVTQFLGFWDETEEEKAAKKAKEEAKAREDAESQSPENVAQSELIEDNPSQTAAVQVAESHTDDHPDLQLQPNDAAGREGTERGAG